MKPKKIKPKPPATRKPGPKPGAGGRPRKDAASPRVPLNARVRPDTLARLRAQAAATQQSLGDLLDSLAADLPATSTDPAPAKKAPAQPT